MVCVERAISELVCSVYVVVVWWFSFGDGSPVDADSGIGSGERETLKPSIVVVMGWLLWRRACLAAWLLTCFGERNMWGSVASWLRAECGGWATFGRNVGSCGSLFPRRCCVSFNTKSATAK